MKQTFNDLCRDRSKAGRALFGFALWIFLETFVGIIRENASSISKRLMKRDPAIFLTLVKFTGLAISALMVAGIAALMVLARGKGEDITGIVAPAILITFMSLVAAAVAAILQKRAKKTMDANK